MSRLASSSRAAVPGTSRECARASDSKCSRGIATPNNASPPSTLSTLAPDSDSRPILLVQRPTGSSLCLSPRRVVGLQTVAAGCLALRPRILRSCSLTPCRCSRRPSALCYRGDRAFVTGTGARPRVLLGLPRMTGRAHRRGSSTPVRSRRPAFRLVPTVGRAPHSARGRGRQAVCSS